MKTILITAGVIIVLIGLYYLVKYLMNKYGNSDERVIETDREVITEETIVRSTPMQSFNPAPRMSFGAPSMGGMGARVGAGAGASAARVVGGGNQ